MAKTPNSKEAINGDKTPKAIEETGSYYHKNPSWRFAKADMEHKDWSVLDDHEDVVVDPNDPDEAVILHQFSKSIDRELLDHLKDRESTTWGTLLTQNGGRSGGTNSHNIPIYELTKDAQRRAAELQLDTDVLMSLRLEGVKRVFGILGEDGVLEIICVALPIY